jgi:endonuclease III
VEKSDLLGKIADVLAREYGTPDLGNQKDPLDELIFVKLCAETGPKNVRKAYVSLKARFKKWDQVLKAPNGEVARTIRIAGLSNRREAQIKTILKSIQSKRKDLDLGFLRGMKDDEVYKWLTSLDEVGSKIAHCVMLFSLDRNVMPIDTHNARILKRLGLVEPKKSNEEISLEIKEVVPNGTALLLHVNFVAHGRRTCRAYSPKCDNCCISSLCAYNGYHVLAKP